MKSNIPERSKKSSNAESVPQKALAWRLAFAVVMALASVTFLPTLRNSFVDWDDLENFVDNPRYRGLGWSHLGWMFTTFHMGHYQPLSWVSLGLDYLLWGMNPAGYHVTNLVIHTANAGFFYVVSRRLLTMIWRAPENENSWRLTVSAALSALLFALHPLRVESVAWATERRDVLSGFFYLGAIYFYLRAHSGAHADAGSRQWLRRAVTFYALSLLSKATAITLPAVLLLLDIYPLRRLKGGLRHGFTPQLRAVWREKAPFLLLAAVFAVTALWAQQQASALRALDSYDAQARVAQAFYGLNFYLWKTLLPINLSPLYEIPPGLSLWTSFYLASAVGVAIVTVGLYLIRNRWPAGLACWVYYVVVLAPVLGIVQSGPQLVADRYSYLSCLGWAVLAGGLIFHFWRSLEATYKVLWVSKLVPAAGFAIALILASQAWTQTLIWRDTKTLWTHVIALNPDSSIAHYNLARYLAKHGDQAAAISHYRQALRVNPDDAEARNNLGLLLALRGEIEAASEEFRRAVQIDPNYAKAYFNMGRVLAREGDLENAMRHFKRALALSPKESEIHLGLGRILALRGNLDDAVTQIREALRLRSDFADAHVALARILAAKGDREQAEKHYQEALRLLKSQTQPTPSP